MTLPDRIKQIIILWSVGLALLSTETDAWASRSFSSAVVVRRDGSFHGLHRHARQRRAPKAEVALAATAGDSTVDALSLAPLGDHAAVGSALAGSVQRWLDAEWMPQDCHRAIGEACGATYVRCRTAEGETDLAAVMLAVADTLAGDWAEAYDDAFVNAWDVANYVSDYLTKELGVERCECSARIY